jgi:beta-lactamase regulating signal transducer with metallopeptidase domain
MTPLAHALSTALLHFIWQGIVIGVLLWIALFLFRRKSPNSRYVVSCLAVAVLAAAPVITVWVLYNPLPDAGVVVHSGAATVVAGEAGTSLQATSRIASWYASVEASALPAWSLGVLLFALRLAWSCGHAAALRREGTPTEMWILSSVDGAAKRLGLQRHIRVLMSSIAEVPSVVGWIRPVILLPAATIAGLTPQQLEAVIAHELAHVRRHDYLVNLLQTVVETLLFYHPVVWWASASIRRERELCCDDLAVRSCGDAVCYARALTKLEKLRVWKPGLAMNSAHGPLFERIQRVLTGEGGKGPSRFACAVGLLAGIVCLAFSMSWAQERRDENRVNTNEVAQELLTVPAAPPVPPVPPAAPISPVAPPPAAVAPAEPAPPAPPLPPAAPAAASPVLIPVPPMPPIPPIVFSQGDETPWALFRGQREILNGSSADQAAARAARTAAGGGDMLWFRQDGKAYIIQDPDILARIEALLEPANAQDAQKRVAEVQQRALELRNADAQLQQANVSASIAVLQANIAKLQASAQQLRPDELQASLSQLQAQIADLQNKIQRTQVDALSLSQQQADLAKQLAIVQRQRADLARFDAELAAKSRSEMFNLLRESVSAGKAKPLQ